MVAKEWIETFKPVCEFHEQAQADPGEPEWPVCGKPAVAVYVTADHLSRGRFICEQHATEAEQGGDGPVFRTEQGSV